LKPTAFAIHETDSTKIPIPIEEAPEQIIKFVRHDDEEDFIGQGWKTFSEQDKEEQLTLLREKVKKIHSTLILRFDLPLMKVGLKSSDNQ
jgi:hypothetical protein